MLSYRIGVSFTTTKLVVSYFDNSKPQTSEKIRINERLSPQQLFQISSSFTHKPEEPINLDALAGLFSKEMLLSVSNCFNSSPHKDKLVSIVLSIPETWYVKIDGAVKLKLEQLLAYQLGIEEKLFKLIREPTAAAAYWIWMMMQQKLKWNGNLLICDLEDHKFNVSLCQIDRENKVKILYSDWQPQAGLPFDSQCIKIAYAQKHGLPLTEDNPEFLSLLGVFKQEKVNSHQRSTERLMTYLKTPAAMANYNLYCFGGGYAVKCQQINDAFLPIQQVIQKTIQRLNTWMQSHQQYFDFLFFIGGDCRFILAKNAILQALEIQDHDARFDSVSNDDRCDLAIAYGACLIANCLIDPVEKFPYTLGIIAERLNVYAERERKLIPLVQENTNLDSLLVPYFADIPLLTVFQGNSPIITLQLNSGNQKPFLIIDVKLDNIQFDLVSANQLWQVGIRMNPLYNLYLLIQNFQTKNIVEYPIGTLPDLVGQLKNMSI